MTKKTLAPILAPIPSDDESSSGEDSHIELRPPSGLTKTGKPKKEWVYTEARKQAFERARKAREEMGNTKKQIIETKAKLREVKKEKLTKLKDAVEVEVKKKEKLEKKLAPSSDSIRAVRPSFSVIVLPCGHRKTSFAEDGPILFDDRTCLLGHGSHHHHQFLPFCWLYYHVRFLCMRLVQLVSLLLDHRRKIDGICCQSSVPSHRDHSPYTIDPHSKILLRRGTYIPLPVIL